MLAFLAALLVIVPGCDRDREPPERDGLGSAPSEVTTAPPTDPGQAAEQAAIQAYEGMWAAFDRAGQPPTADPEDPQLQQHATGQALETLVDGLTSMREEGLVTEGAVVLSPSVTRLVPEDNPTEAEIEDCADSTDWRQVRADGQPYEDEPGGRRRIVAELELMADGAWQVVNFAVLEVGSC